MSWIEYHILDLPNQYISGGWRVRGRLYYYGGNFFHLVDLTANEPGLIARAIRDFKKQHSAMIARDRASPEYQTLEQLSGVE